MNLKFFLIVFYYKNGLKIRYKYSVFNINCNIDNLVYYFRFIKHIL